MTHCVGIGPSADSARRGMIKIWAKATAQPPSQVIANNLFTPSHSHCCLPRRSMRRYFADVALLHPNECHMMKPNGLIAVVTMMAVWGCAHADPSPHDASFTMSDAATAAAGQQGFWDALSRHCGSAYRGSLTLEPPGDDMLTGTEELIVHFRECSQTEIRAPFHIEQEAAADWDRSRTWVFMRTAQGLELRHDHRHRDGTPDETTWYGGHTATPGSAERQEFVYAESRATDGLVRGWRVEIVPGERYTYGTIRGGEWTWRVDFDLRQSVPAPPAPWGHQ